MSLPASEDTTTLRQGFVLIERVSQDDHIPITNTGVAINQGDFVMKTPYFGLADEDIAATSGLGTIHVGQVYRVGTDMTGDGESFGTWGQEVYWSTTKSKFFESEGDGNRYLVGYVREVADSDGVWAFEGLRFHGAEAST
jgi:predicted RecA/RadA family phage recombinase